jgi:hypothetical protein
LAIGSDAQIADVSTDGMSMPELKDAPARSIIEAGITQGPKGVWVRGFSAAVNIPLQTADGPKGTPAASF